jgi:hypothetical protein
MEEDLKENLPENENQAEETQPEENNIARRVDEERASKAQVVCGSHLLGT